MLMHLRSVTSCYTSGAAFAFVNPFPLVALAPSAASSPSASSVYIDPRASQVISDTLGSGLLSFYPYNTSTYDGALVQSINGLVTQHLVP